MRPLPSQKQRDDQRIYDWFDSEVRSRVKGGTVTIIGSHNPNPLSDIFLSPPPLREAGIIDGINQGESVKATTEPLTRQDLTNAVQRLNDEQQSQRWDQMGDDL